MQRQGDGAHGYLLKRKLQKSSENMFSPSSANLAVVGFPTSLKPFDITYLPRESGDAKMRKLLAHPGGDHGLKPSHPVAMVTHDRCGRSVGPVSPHPRSAGSEASAKELRTTGKHNERSVIAAAVGGELEADTYPGKAAMRIMRGSLGLVNEPERRAMMDSRSRDRRLLDDIGLEKLTADVTGREAASPSKKLKFGIESILAIGSKTSEKTDRNNNKDGHHATPSQLPAHWSNDSAGVDVKRGSEIYDCKTPTHPVSKPALRRPFNGLSSPSASCALWGGGATQVLLADGRWDGAPSRLVEVGPTGWGFRNKSREFQDLGTHHNPYQLVRNAELGNAHPQYALRTALPPVHHHHPTLPRSYHHVHPVVHVPSSRPPHFQNGGGGGDPGAKAHNFGVSGGILGCGSGGIGVLGSGGHKRKRSWSRAVFTSLQRKGLEKRFEIQKYVNKPERRQLASALGLSDAQVKVWFQNRRMKWRHSQQFKRSPHPEQQHPNQQHDQDTEQPEENVFHSDSDESSIRLSSTTPDIKLGNGDATFEVGAIFIANADDSGDDNNGSGDDDVDDSQK